MLLSVSFPPRLSHPWSPPNLSFFSAHTPSLSLPACFSHINCPFSFLISLCFSSLCLSPPPLSDLPLFNPRQFQFHIYYIFSSINPITNWVQELPEDAQNMFQRGERKAEGEGINLIKNVEFCCVCRCVPSLYIRIHGLYWDPQVWKWSSYARVCVRVCVCVCLRVFVHEGEGR